MKILFVSESASWADAHLAVSLEALGHHVERFFYGEAVGEFYGSARAYERAGANRRLYELARRLTHQGCLDLIFCYVYDDFLLPSTASALARLDVPMVNLNVDMTNQWYRQSRTARYFTRILCAQRIHMVSLRRFGANVMYFPMAGRSVAPPTDSGESSSLKPAAPVTFVGTPMPYRTALLSGLAHADVPLAVYGKFWLDERVATADRSAEKLLRDLRHYAWARLRCEGFRGLLEPLRQRLPHRRVSSASLPRSALHGFVPGVALPAFFRDSAINLGFTRMVGDHPERPGTNQVKLRDFEVPLAGGFYLVEEAPEYDELFRPGAEVETWSTPGELLDKIRYYLANESERKAIADAGRRRALAEHTWAHRFQMLFNELGLSGQV